MMILDETDKITKSSDMFCKNLKNVLFNKKGAVK